MRASRGFARAHEVEAWTHDVEHWADVGLPLDCRGCVTADSLDGLVSTREGGGVRDSLDSWPHTHSVTVTYLRSDTLRFSTDFF